MILHILKRKTAIIILITCGKEKQNGAFIGDGVISCRGMD